MGKAFLCALASAVDEETELFRTESATVNAFQQGTGFEYIRVPADERSGIIAVNRTERDVFNSAEHIECIEVIQPDGSLSRVDSKHTFFGVLDCSCDAEVVFMLLDDGKSHVFNDFFQIFKDFLHIVTSCNFDSEVALRNFWVSKDI